MGRCGSSDRSCHDGVDQRAFLEGTDEGSAREGFLFWNGPKLFGVKWHNFKMALVDQKDFWDAPKDLIFPRIINLETDPQEREPINHQYLHTWTMNHFIRLITEFEKSTREESLIPMGAPLDHIPTSDTE